MRTLEIVHLRRCGPDLAGLRRQIRDSLGQTADSAAHVTVYRRCGLGTDFAIHIHHRARTLAARPTVLGERLADALRQHGMVAHSLWEELL